MPYFLRVEPDDVNELRQELEQANERTRTVQQQLAEAVARLEEARARLLEGGLSRAEAERQAAALGQCESELRAAGETATQLNRVNAELDSCRQALLRTFVLAVASWSSRDDVDLHVVDPAGREFYYANRRQRGSRAALEEDNVNGPGNEVWLHPSAESGRYRICYKLYRFRGSGTPRVGVRGSILWQDGKVDFPNVTLTGRGQVRLAVEVMVNEQGRVALDGSRSGQVLGTGGCR